MYVLLVIMKVKCFTGVLVYTYLYLYLDMQTDNMIKWFLFPQPWQPYR